MHVWNGMMAGIKYLSKETNHSWSKYDKISIGMMDKASIYSLPTFLARHVFTADVLLGLPILSY